MRLPFFSPSAPLEETFFRMVKFILSFLGVWPLDSITPLTVFKIFINLSTLVIGLVGELRFIWVVRSDSIKVLAGISPFLTGFVTLMKILSFIFYRRELADLLNDLLGHLREDTKDSRKNAMILDMSFLTTMLSLWLWFFAVCTNWLFVLTPFTIWVYQRFAGETDSWVELPFQVALPYEDMTQLQNKTLYTILFCILAFSGNATTFGFSGVDGAFMCFCMYMSVSYQCLQEDFKDAFKRYTRVGKLNVNPFRTPTDELQSDYIRNDQLWNELSELVKRQQKIINIFERFNNLFKFMVFGHFLVASIVLGIVLFELLLTSGMSKGIYLAYVMGAGSQVFFYCYGAEKLNESCLKLSETLYFCDWYKCDRRVRKLVLFVMMRTQKGSLLNAPFFAPSFPLFAAIIKTSGSYITLLQAFV